MITAIVPTYNRTTYLSEAIASCVRQKQVSEVLIIDDGSNQRAKQELRSVTESHKIVKLIQHDQNQGLPAARNTGVEFADNSLVLFGEDDMVFDHDYTDVLLEHMSKTGANIIAGRLIQPANKTSKSHESLNEKPCKTTNDVIDMRTLVGNFTRGGDICIETPFVHACSLIDKKVFDNIKYDELTYKVTYFREETDFYLRAKKEGAKIVYCPVVSATHHDSNDDAPRSGCSPNTAFRAKIWHFINNTRFILKNWKIIKDEVGISPIRPLFHYTTKGIYNSFKL